MVLSNSNILNNSNGSACKGPIEGLKIVALNSLTVKHIFTKLCKACQLKTMASIPPSAFSAKRIRETQRDMKVSKPNKSGESGKFFNTNRMELSPLKYISEFMNSIWGQYNRFSPHNVKNVNDANVNNWEMQQSAAAFPTGKSEPKVTLLSTKLENVWAAVNVSQSH